MLDAWTIKEWLLFWGCFFMVINGAGIAVSLFILARVNRLLAESELVRLVAPALKRSGSGD